jgi:hypothetical protein
MIETFIFLSVSHHFFQCLSTDGAPEHRESDDKHPHQLKTSSFMRRMGVDSALQYGKQAMGDQQIPSQEWG